MPIPPLRQHTFRRPTICFATSKQKPSLSISSLQNTGSTLYGGDFAGICATFSSHNGALIKVPEHLVPESLLEWGAEPSALETIVSEDVSLLVLRSDGDDDDDDDNNNDQVLTRHTVQILPAVGCGVDNLDTMKQTEVQQIQCLRLSQDGSVISFDVPLRGNENDIGTTDGSTIIIVIMTRAETTFATRDGNRLRVDITVEYDTATRGFSLSNPIHVALERQISKESSHGTIANGGGLTGSRVTELVGASILQPPLFCDQTPLDWSTPDPEIKVLNLSGNITIATSLDSKQDPWILDVVYVDIDHQGQAEKEVVRRTYHAPMGNPEKLLTIE